MRILITGITGQVGYELCRYEWPEDVEIVAASRQELDLTDAGSIETYIAEGRFDAVINPAAYTAVDRAETDPVTAWKVNALAPAVMAEATRKVGIPLLCVSTDYVFDGTKAEAYDEGDPIGPVGVYGASKAAGELAVRTGNPRHAILRTSWVFSAHGANFVKTMLRLAADRPLLRVVDDQNGCPTAASDIAATLARMALRLVADPKAPTGTYHFSNAGPVTWCGFAREIFRQQAALGYAVPKVEAITTADYPTPAKRPANSVLGVEKIGRDYAIRPRPWQEALSEVLSELRLEQRKSPEEPR
ncbi:dTDP-4-dehydrorhamnose reductase [Rhizobiaceae bacterium BDR2-2]|uniref:dTDP-4-dehydrorhamnose reductase n=1 Tax=Ectorhizobium quercum TaxID=2965071 RepID=A0AAE3N195_9HYPH|nr:dTDP-4-dehydrorhamnose reductase [Ectorhizobium quercum]MCX8996197.1 dTDP-4-dehydrorhamnose reductase [Ectorhizobium quercum]MCX8998764.1 dTDP-4-dehydrorhamnose reductase [Ectorhizobium quercum]